MQKILLSHNKTDLLFAEHDGLLRSLGMFPKNIAKKIIKSLPEFPALTPFTETELHLTGENQELHHGNRIIAGSLGRRIVYTGMTESKDGKGFRVVTINYKDPVRNLTIESFYKFVPGTSVVKRWVKVINTGDKPAAIEQVSSAMVQGLGLGGTQSWHDKMVLHLCHSTWCCEGQWKSGKLHEFGLSRCRAKRAGDEYTAWQGVDCISVSQTGTWSTMRYLPMGVLHDTESDVSWSWQIENNGSWYWELGDVQGLLYLFLGGPNEQYNHWWKNLQPGQSFTTAPVAVGVTPGGFDNAIEQMTIYRRKECLMPHQDNKKLPVIFNDYMNCLNGDPTEERELPVIEAASKIGCEYFVIDAGWYAPRAEGWWTTVGAWQPSPDRFPNGLKSLLDKIRQKGMIPGLWLEIEVAGINSPLKDKPDAWFMMRHGQRVIDNGRYFLDYRNPEVIAYVNEVIDRVVNEYGAGYIKIDYNVTAKMGTELSADSFGDGLLQHNRAYLAWLDSVHQRHPDLVIENCSSGGCRSNYALLSKCQLLSSSDQMEYKLYPSVLSGGMAGCLPEQLAVWSYPMESGDEEETVFNMVNAMLSRIHQSGQVDKISDRRLALVKQGIDVYKTYRHQIPDMVPFWPDNMVSITDQDTWYSLGLKHQTKRMCLLSVWRIGTTSRTHKISLPFLKGKKVSVSQIYPLSDSLSHSSLSSPQTQTKCVIPESLCRGSRLSVRAR
jgi:alpha-galactosidase